MLEDNEKFLIEGNYLFQFKKIYNLENHSFEKRIPKYPILFLSCMNPRIEIHNIFQLYLDDVYILRNAGNICTQDMMRSILIAIHKYKVKQIVVLGHSDCGMTKIDMIEFRKNLSTKFLKLLAINYSDLLSKLYDFFKPFDNEIRNIIQQMNDLQEIKAYFPHVEITGMLYDIQSGWIFTKEDFRNLLIDENHSKIYKRLLYEKNRQLSKFLETKDDIRQSIEVQFKEIQTKELDLHEENEVLEIEEKNVEVIGDNELQETVDDNSEIFQLKVPKIQIPKIYIPKLKIHIPRSAKIKKD